MDHQFPKQNQESTLSRVLFFIKKLRFFEFDKREEIQHLSDSICRDQMKEWVILHQLKGVDFADFPPLVFLSGISETIHKVMADNLVLFLFQFVILPPDTFLVVLDVQSLLMFLFILLNSLEDFRELIVLDLEFIFKPLGIDFHLVIHHQFVARMDSIELFEDGSISIVFLNLDYVVSFFHRPVIFQWIFFYLVDRSLFKLLTQVY